MGVFALGALLLTACGGGASGVESTPTPVQQPNILLLVADDMGLDALSSYGLIEDTASTPNLDALAADGVRFTRVWSSPVCSPTRASIQTGRYGFRTGVGQLVRPNNRALRLAERTLPEMLDEGTDGAYAHATFGKWHLGNESVGGAFAPNRAGYQHFEGTLTSIAFPDSYSEWDQVVDGDVERMEGYVTSHTVDTFLGWVGQVQEPWFAYVPFNAPHPPFHVPPAELFTRELSSPPTNRDMYIAMVEALDAEIGRLLRGLSAEERERTVVLFVGDNGTPSSATVAPFDANHAKATIYEGGVRVPLLIQGPGVERPGSVCEALVHTADLYATIAELAGVDLAGLAPGLPLDATSVVPYLSEPERNSIRSYLFTELFRPNAAPTPAWAPPCEGVELSGGCHEDLGFAGPGAVELELCWEPGTPETDVTVSVEGGPPGASGIVFGSDISEPASFEGGTLVPGPNPFLIPFPFTLNDEGAARFSMTVEFGIEAVFYQAVVDDADQVQGTALSNAVKGTFPDHRVAVRDERFKLILDPRTCRSEFYDLDLDPFEATNLLEGALSGAALAAFENLENILRSLEPAE